MIKGYSLAKVCSLFFIFMVFEACSMRDYDNPLINELYNPPTLHIYSPLPNSTNTGNVMFSGEAQDISGVSRVIVTYDDQTVTLYNPAPETNQSTNFIFNTNLYIYQAGHKTLVIVAVDAMNIASTNTLPIVVNGPVVKINTELPYSTKETNWALSGHCYFDYSAIDRVEIKINSHLGQEKTQNATLSDTNWNANVTLYPNTTNTIRVTVYSQSGMYSYEERHVIVDSEPPAITALNPSPNQHLPPNVNFSFSTTDNLSGVKAFYIQIDSKPYSVIWGSWGQSHWNYSYNFTTNRGNHTVSYYAVDYALNTTATQSIQFTVDTNRPIIQVMTPTNNMETPMNYEIGLSFNDAMSGVQYLNISVNGQPFNRYYPSTEQSYYTIWMNAAMKGLQNLDVYSEDYAGNVSLTQNVQYYVDITPPELSVVYPQPAIDTPRQFRGQIYMRDALSHKEWSSVFFKFDGGTYQEAYTDMYPYTNWFFTTPTILSAGNHTLFVYALDLLNNATITQQITFNVDGSIPVSLIQSPPNYQSTNVNTFEITGVADVSVGNIQKIEISINNTAFVNVNNYTAGLPTVYFTNNSTISLTNQYIPVIVRAISSDNKTNYSQTNYYAVDQTPPKVEYLYPTNHAVLANIAGVYTSIQVSENFSGIHYITLDSFGEGVTAISVTNYSSTYADYWVSSVKGAVVTNIITIADYAGNKRVVTNTYTLMPNVYVSDMGDDNNSGIGTKPFKSIDKGVTIALKNNILNVLVSQGLYTSSNPSIVITNDLNLYGGYDYAFNVNNPNTYITKLQGYTDSAIKILKGRVNLHGLRIEDSGNQTTSLGGALYVTNANVEINALYCLSNRALLGGNIYVVNSTVLLTNSEFSMAKAKMGSGIYLLNSSFNTKSVQYLGNYLQSDLAAPIVDFGSVFYASNCNLYIESNRLKFNASLDGKPLRLFDIYGNGWQTILHNNEILTNYGNSNMIGIFLDGYYSDLAIKNNVIELTNITMSTSIGIYENSSINGHTLSQNTFVQNRMDFFYYDYVNGNINSPMNLNDPAKTTANNTSTDNITVNW